MPYAWIRFFHIVSAVGFIAIHGASMVVLYAIRRERERSRIESLLGFSAKTVVSMYLSLLAVVGTGFWLAFVVPGYFGQAWYWLALGLLIVTTGFMWMVARPFGKRIRAACELRPSGVPRISDEELDQILRSQKTNVITAVGVIAFGVILYLMVFQPAF